MLIHYIGNFGPEWSTENDVRLALEELGHEVLCLQENKVTYEDWEQQLHQHTPDLLLWTGTWIDAELAQRAADIAGSCAAMGVPTAAYHLDVFWGLGRGGTPWQRKPEWKMADVFTADGDHPIEWDRMGVRHHWLPAGVRHSAVFDGMPRPEFEADVAFVGSDGHGYHEDVWEYRIELVDWLERTCHTRGWTFRNPGGREPKVDRADMNDFYASVKVTVGDSLCLAQAESLYWSDRVYEAPGRGGLLIMPKIKALRKSAQFGPSLPMYPWGGFGELEKQIAFFLERPATRESLRTKCQSIVRDKHTYVHRMQTLLDILGLS